MEYPTSPSQMPILFNSKTRSGPLFNSLKFVGLILLAFVAIPVVANADWVIDDFAGAAPNPGASVVVDPGTTLDVDRVMGDGYKFEYPITGSGSETVVAKLTYSFAGGLHQYISTRSDPGDIVRFEVPIWEETAGVQEGTWTVTASIVEGGSTTSFFTTTFNDTGNQTDPYIMNTPRTVGDLTTTDIDGLEIDVSYSIGTFIGFNEQILYFGGTGNGATNGSLIAAPEPTSVIMFGSLIGGMMFRRRRK